MLNINYIRRGKRRATERVHAARASWKLRDVEGGWVEGMIRKGCKGEKRGRERWDGNMAEKVRGANGVAN